MFKDPILVDQNKNRSDFTEHPKQNNKYLTPASGGQFDPEKGGLFDPVSGGHFDRFFQNDGKMIAN